MDAMKKGDSNIPRLRKEIDEIDKELVTLLNRRAAFVMEVGKAKAAENREFYAPEREREIYRRIEGLNKGPFPTKALKDVFREIMSASLALERPVRVAFLGPPATFTHQACLERFGMGSVFSPKKDIPEVFDDVEKGRSDFGVVPIENTTEGVVSHTLDMFVTSDLKICAESLMPVSLALLNRSGKRADIRKVCSHPNPLGQSRNWLKNNLPGAALEEVSSTAVAAEMAASDQNIAAVASVAAASLYGLCVIERDIQDNANNFTRFLVIGKKTVKKTGVDKTSIVFAVKDAPGALYAVLKPFARRGINLTKIESRPVKTRAWEYVFYVDLDGYASDKKVKDSLSELERLCSFFKVLGSYPKSDGIKT